MGVREWKEFINNFLKDSIDAISEEITKLAFGDGRRVALNANTLSNTRYFRNTTSSIRDKDMRDLPLVVRGCEGCEEDDNALIDIRFDELFAKFIPSG